MSSGPAITLEQRYLLTYYMHTLVPIFSVFTGSTTYHTSLYIPMAFDSPGVLNAILARSASHLAMTNVEADRIAHFTQLATFHQLLCHQYLQQCVFNVGDPSSTSDEIIATVMLLIALETQNGTKNQKYMKQLQCARKIVATRGGPRHFIDAGWEAQCVFGHFLYHEVMVSIMNEVEDNAANGSSHDAGGPITNLGTDSMPIDWNSSYTVDLGPRIDPLMGLSSSLFLKIRQISLLKRLPPGCNERNQLFLTLEHEITEWCVQQDYAAGKRVNGLDLAAQMDLIALAETCRLAALILLYRTSDRHFDILVKLAKQIMEFVARIPDGNQVEAGLLFPLFLAGGELLAWTEMEACAIRLSRIKERTRFMNILDVEEVLERVWRSRLNGIQSDWVQVLIEEHRLVHVA
ncbi:MAG: hypothetical protein M1818_004738 [Claussenomyces sp. TS43310]|nr:MAG: hypothetical protein M1818_004738 [Claussenomyces sp. TS43310]